MAQVEASLFRYFEQLDRADREAPSSADAKTARLEDKIALLKQEMQRLKKLGVRMLNAPDKQVF